MLRVKFGLSQWLLISIPLSGLACASILGDEYEIGDANVTSAGGAAGLAGASGGGHTGGTAGSIDGSAGAGGTAASMMGSDADAMRTDAPPRDTSSEDAPTSLNDGADVAEDVPPDIPPSCVPTNGTCSMSGTLSCDSGFANCNGSALDGCEVDLAGTSQKLCGNTCVPAASCCDVADCTSIPTPTACFGKACSGVGGTCSYPMNGGARVCGATCCNGIQGTCNIDCSLNCAFGYGDCNTDSSDGCEFRTNTIQRCGGCNNQCDTMHSIGATCDGLACHYSMCANGYSNCNVNGADLNGCECATPGCCGSSCQTKHVACMLGGNPNTPCTDGTGLNYYDCVNVGTFNSIQATEACTAYAGSSANCTALTCVGGHSVVCNDKGGPTKCTCWEYSGANTGHVHKATLTEMSCYCPISGDPTWN
jgi:hypothetical protein